MSENKINSYEFDEYRLDIHNFQLLENGESVSLTQKSFELLLFLVENRGRILKKEELLDALWEGNFVEEANLTQHIYMLRKVLKQKDRQKVFIETIPKNGYRFLADVHLVYQGENQISLNGHTTNEDIIEEGFLNDQYENDFLSGHLHHAGSFKDASVDENDKPLRNIFSSKSLAIISVIGIIVTSAAVYYLQNNIPGFGNDTNKNNSYAVLPFKQIKGDKDEKLGIGIADVLIARLANIEEITVSPTTSILRFAETDNSDLNEIGKKLDVDWIISGTIQRDKENVRVTTQLFDVKRGKQLWTETIDEKYSDIFTLQDNISEKVARKVSMNLKVSSSALSYRQYTTDIEAYQAYSMGLSYWTMHNRPGFENAIIQFKKAIEKDPHFTLAYAYLADSYAHTGHITNLMPKAEARKKSEEAAKNALELDSNCAEAMAALALVYANQNKQTEAFQLMKKSIEIKPNDAHARHRISWMYANKGMIDKSVKEMKIAQKLDPQSAYINLFLGDMLSFARKPDEAITSYQKALEIEPTSFDVRWKLIKAYEQKGELFKAEKQLEKILAAKVLGDSALLLVKSRILAKRNKKAEAKKILDQVISNGKLESLYFLIAQVQIALGEDDEAINSLEKVIPRIEDNIYTIKFEPNLDPIRDNKRFISLLKEKEKKQGWL